MSRILVVGVGVPSLVPAPRHGGPGLRSAHFAAAIAGAGHDVLLLAVLAEGEELPCLPPQPVRPGLCVELVRERELASPLLRARLARFAPQAVVGATAYASALAARLRLEVPLWADVFGDLMAEAQAKAARTSSDWSLVHFWTLMRAVLERGDRFSAVSRAQSHALVGQLGLAGRLSSRTAGEELVSVVPCAAEIPAQRPGREASRRMLGIGERDFVLLVSGGVNTWCDVETLAVALGLAMEAEPRLRLVLTGGAIAGHDEASHAELRRRLGALPASRVRDLGWIDSDRLPGVYAAADLGLHVERTIYERRLGAENRVVEWLAHGLACVTTAQSESGVDLVREGLALGAPAADARALAATIVAASREPDLDAAARALAEARRRGPGWVARERSYAAAAASLVEWCGDPCFARDRDGARLLQLGLVSQPATSAEMLEAYVAALPAREILRRGARWIVRRAHGAARGALGRATASPSVSAPPDATAAPASRRRRFPFVLPALLVLLSSWTGAGCTREPGPARSGPPNILLLSIDTLRHDHLGAYGYAVTPSPTPWMDELASRGVLYETAVTSAPETAPALATLLTGVYQDRHGVLYNRGTLVEKQATLAERLKEAGYATAAFVGNWLADPKRGFAQGFDRYEVVVGEQTIDDRLAALAGEYFLGAGKAPWFLWVHMMDPHGPYSSAPPWWSGQFDYSKAPLARDGDFEVSYSNFGFGVIPRYQNIQGVTRLSEYVRRYDGDIRFTDTQVGAVLGMLEASGQSDNTIVVLTADHGESLVEHDELLQHGWFVYDTTVRIPLIVAWPGRLPEAARVREQVCAVDIAPTLLELAGIEADGAGFDGRILPRTREGGRGEAAAAAAGDAGSLRAAGCFSVGPRPNHLFSVRSQDHKLIVTPAGTPRDPLAEKGEVTSDPERVELYDLARDPGETADLAASDPERVESMKQAVTSLRSRFRAHGWRW